MGDIAQYTNPDTAEECFHAYLECEHPDYLGGGPPPTHDWSIDGDPQFPREISASSSVDDREAFVLWTWMYSKYSR